MAIQLTPIGVHVAPDGGVTIYSKPRCWCGCGWEDEQIIVDSIGKAPDGIGAALKVQTVITQVLSFLPGMASDPETELRA